MKFSPHISVLLFRIDDLKAETAFFRVHPCVRGHGQTIAGRLDVFGIKMTELSFSVQISSTGNQFAETLISSVFLCGSTNSNEEGLVSFENAFGKEEWRDILTVYIVKDSTRGMIAQFCHAISDALLGRVEISRQSSDQPFHFFTAIKCLMLGFVYLLKFFQLANCLSVTIVGVGVSFFIERIQYVTVTGLCELNDLFYNIQGNLQDINVLSFSTV